MSNLTDLKIHALFQQLGNSLSSFKVVLSTDKKEDKIEEFESNFVLFCDLLKLIIESKGQEVILQKDIIQEAFDWRLIDQKEIWLNMLRDHNQIFYIGNKESSHDIYINIKEYYLLMQKTFHTLHLKFTAKT